MHFANILCVTKAKLRASLIFFLVLFYTSICVTAKASNSVSSMVAKEADLLHGGEKEFNPTATILEHIGDTHSWHIIGSLSIPLPVILCTPKGFECFSSARFLNAKHEPIDYQGEEYTYRMQGERIFILDANNQIDKAISAKVIDFSITKNVSAMLIAAVLILVIFIRVAKSYEDNADKAPKGIQSFLEPIIVFVRDEIAKPNIGYQYERFMPVLLTFFFFIWFNNLLGLIPIFPGSANVTGNIAVTMVLAVTVFILVNVNGNKYYWKHIFMPDVPLWLLPIMWIVEVIGILSKPFALMVRLFANITAGHIIVLSLISLIFIFKSLAIAPISIAFTLFMDTLELLVAFLQAFIFTMLASLFIGSAVEEYHH